MNCQHALQLFSQTNPRHPVTAKMEDSSKTNDLDKENDAHRLETRQRQIDFAIITKGYKHYRIAKHLDLILKTDINYDLKIPNINLRCSKKHFDLLLSDWKKKLHLFDSYPLPEFDMNTPKWRAEQAVIDAALLNIAKRLTDNNHGNDPHAALDTNPGQRVKVTMQALTNNIMFTPSRAGTGDTTFVNPLHYRM
jgi:hypothetical protein